MRLVFIAYLRGFGGAQRQIINVANAMSEKKHDVTLISLADNKKCYDISPGVKFIYIEDNRVGALRIIKRYTNLKKVLKRIKPEVVVNFWFQSAAFTALMKSKLGFKVVYSERSDPNNNQYKGVLGIIRKFSLKRIDGLVFQTNAAKEYFDNSVQNKSVVIPNAVSVRALKTKTDCKNKTIVTVGRLHEQKNIPLLIDAFADFIKDYPDYKLLIYGEGELRKQLQEYIDNKGLSKKAKLCGASKDVHDKIVNAEMFVLSSNYEGMPNALIEAMMLGLPCISTDWRPGGVMDIIKDGKNGIIVPRNNKEELCSAMKKLISNRKLSKIIIQNSSIDTSKKFSPETVFGAWEQFLSSIVREQK